MSAPPPFVWTAGEIHADVVLGVGLLALAYAIAWTRRPRTGLRCPAVFMAALVVLLVALNGPLHDLSDYYLFSAHMVQHLLLTLVVPPLLLAGTPGWMADAIVERLRRWPGVGGLITWVPAGLIPLTAFTVVFFRWAAAEDDEVGAAGEQPNW